MKFNDETLFHTYILTLMYRLGAKDKLKRSVRIGSQSFRLYGVKNWTLGIVPINGQRRLCYIDSGMIRAVKSKYNSVVEILINIIKRKYL